MLVSRKEKSKNQHEEAEVLQVELARNRDSSRVAIRSMQVMEVKQMGKRRDANGVALAMRRTIVGPQCV